MVTIALIGGDGSGKSTLAARLVDEAPQPTKYLYMGANIESSNYALPWSRYALRRKLRRLAREADEAGIVDASFVSTHHMHHRQRPSSALRTFLRLSNRLLEAGYRHSISWRWQRRGHDVIYDRHFVFDTFLSSDSFRSSDRVGKINWLYYQALLRLFPEPDIVLFLDADPEVMVSRKNEATVEYLRERNDYWRQQGKDFQRFVTLDANQSKDSVYDEATAAIGRVRRAPA